MHASPVFLNLIVMGFLAIPPSSPSSPSSSSCHIADVDIDVGKATSPL
jgi:hypothetical protein